MSYPDQANRFSGDLRRLTRTIGAGIVFFGLLLLAIIAYAGWSANEASTEHERKLLDNAFNESVAHVLNEQKSVAWWDDAVTKITDSAIDLDFVDANFGFFLTETYDQDEVYILNAKDQPLYAFFDKQRQPVSSFDRRRANFAAVMEEARGARPKLTPRPDMFNAASLERYRFLAGGPQTAHWAGHIMSVAGRPAIVAAITIVPNINMSVLKGTPNLLISVEYIDDEFVSQIGRSLLLKDLALKPRPEHGDGIVSEAFAGDDGIPAGYLSWTTRRPGHVLLTIILPLVAFGVVGTALISRAIFDRLKRTSNELARREWQARHEAKHDPLSGLPNRAHMLEKIDTFLLRRQLENGDERAIAVYLDLDRFKDVNDTLGHAAGDQLIKAVGQRLQSRLRPQEFLSRFGGDEFAILCSPAGADGARMLAERIARAFATPFSLNGQNIRVTASMGIAVAPDNGTTADELMRHADIALYEAKSQGRDRAIVFSAEMAEDVEHRRSIELDLRAALDAGELRLHYQPIISCRSGAIVGAEALLRWDHPVHGELSPTTFIPIAENAGLLPAIGAWVLDRAMDDSKRWPDLEIAVNLSPVQFRRVDLESVLRKLIAQHGVNPGRFVLEITEGVLLDANERTNVVLSAIRSMGFKTALDDFGTRYSSLAYLCNFEFDKIKIDRSFVSRLAKAGAPRTIVQSVVTLGRGLGMDIVAEGIETEIEAITMTNFGCTELQGFYFSKAVSADALSRLLVEFEPKPPKSKPRSAHPERFRAAK